MSTPSPPRGDASLPLGWMKQTSWPAAPLRMPPGVKRTPCASRCAGLVEQVHPDPDVVERRHVHLRRLRQVDRLHRVELDVHRAAAEHEECPRRRSPSPSGSRRPSARRAALPTAPRAAPCRRRRWPPAAARGRGRAAAPSRGRARRPPPPPPSRGRARAPPRRHRRASTPTAGTPSSAAARRRRCPAARAPHSRAPPACLGRRRLSAATDASWRACTCSCAATAACIGAISRPLSQAAHSIGSADGSLTAGRCRPPPAAPRGSPCPRSAGAAASNKRCRARPCRRAPCLSGGLRPTRRSARAFCSAEGRRAAGGQATSSRKL